MRRSGGARAATEYTKAIVEASPIVVVGAGAAAVFKYVVQVRAQGNLQVRRRVFLPLATVSHVAKTDSHHLGYHVRVVGGQRLRGRVRGEEYR